MALRNAVVVPVLLSTLLLPGLAAAAAPDDASAEAEAAIEVGAAPSDAAAPASEPEPAESAGLSEPAAPTEAPAVDAPASEPAPVELSEAERAAVEAAVEAELAAREYEEAEIYDDYEDYTDDWDDDYEPKRTVLELQSGYFGLGIAPGMTIHDSGFHPNTRFELEFGGTLEHRYRDLGLSFGVVSHLTPYYGRKKPSFGADVTSTAILGPIYIRTGLGALGGLPRNHQVENTAPAIGGVVGVGLNFGRAPMVRVGVDYDFRVTTRLEPVHTMFLALRIACCREE